MREMARTEGAKGNGKVKKHTSTAVAMNKVSPAVRFTDMRANAGQRFTVAGAKMSERMTHIRANLTLKLYRLQHPSHPVKRVAATETVKEVKAAATGRSHPALQCSCCGFCFLSVEVLSPIIHSFRFVRVHFGWK